MDFDWNETKKSTQKFGDDILTGAGDTAGAAKKFSDDHSPSKLVDFLDDEIQDMKKTPGSTEDFEHVDPFTHYDSAKEKIGSKVEGASDNFNDFLGAAKSQFDNLKTDIGKDFSEFGASLGKASDDLLGGFDSKIDSTRDFMHAERGGGFVKPTAPPPPPPVTEQKAETKFYDDFADNDSPSFSYNPSPIKKNPTTALKEQDNEKFISSEDLLGDIRSEKTATPEPAADISSKKPLPFKEDSSVYKEQKPSGKVEEKHSRIEEIKNIPAQPKEQKKSPKETQQMISAEEMFYRFGLDTWFKPDRLHPTVESLIYWRDVKKSGIVFGAGLVTLLAISCFSVISVIAYLSLITLAGTIAFRIYKNVMGAIQKTSEGHPFKDYLDMDLTLSQDKVQQICNVAVAHVNAFVAELRRLFLVEDLVDSLKFGVILWVLTYIGAWFNGMTLVILAFVSLFTLPKVYENNKQSIDTYLDLVRTKILEITDKVKTAIPIGKKPETDKDK